MKLSEAIRLAETLVNRPLSDEEIEMVGQVVEAGKQADEIIRLFEDYERPPEVDEDGIAIYRYEPGVDTEDNGPKARQF